jgi:hypothetical protein
MHRALRSTESRNDDFSPLALSTSQLSTALGGLSENSIVKLVRQRKIPFVQLCRGGRLLFPVSEISIWLSENTVKPELENTSSNLNNN